MSASRGAAPGRGGRPDGGPRGARHRLLFRGARCPLLPEPWCGKRLVKQGWPRAARAPGTQGPSNPAHLSHKLTAPPGDLPPCPPAPPPQGSAGMGRSLGPHPSWPCHCQPTCSSGVPPRRGLRPVGSDSGRLPPRRLYLAPRGLFSSGEGSGQQRTQQVSHTPPGRRVSPSVWGERDTGTRSVRNGDQGGSGNPREADTR